MTTAMQFPLLVPGERVRLDPAGQVYIVRRVSPSAAYLACKIRREFDVTTKDGEQRHVVAESEQLIAVSTRAAVYRGAR